MHLLCPYQNVCVFPFLTHWVSIPVRAKLGDMAQASLVGGGICRTGDSCLGTLWLAFFRSRTILHSHKFSECFSFRNKIWHWNLWNLWSCVKPSFFNDRKNEGQIYSWFLWLVHCVMTLNSIRVLGQWFGTKMVVFDAFIGIQGLVPALCSTAIT